MNEGAQVDAVTATYDALAQDCLDAFELRQELLGRIPPARLVKASEPPRMGRRGLGANT